MATSTITSCCKAVLAGHHTHLTCSESQPHLSVHHIWKISPAEVCSPELGNVGGEPVFLQGLKGKPKIFMRGQKR